MNDNPGNINGHETAQDPSVKAHFQTTARYVCVRQCLDGVEGSASGFAPEDEPLAISSSVIPIVRK